VNWVAFHPTMRIVASCADDKSIKLWRLSGNKHWEMYTMKGHGNNVSCVLFHPRLEVVLSNSEDKTLRLWDLNSKTQIHQTRKDTDRYWILASHPNLNYFAAGYDNGMCVFKIERERHSSVRLGSHIFFVKNKNLYFYDLSTKEQTLMSMVNSSTKTEVLLNQPKSIYYNYFNQTSHCIILNFDGDNSCFIIYEFNKDLSKVHCNLEKRGDNTLGAVFISKDKICVLDVNREVAVCNLDGSNIKKVQINKKGLNKVEQLFPAPLGKILVHGDDNIFMYDLAARKVIHELTLPEGTVVKQVQWNNQMSHFVVITSTSLMMLSKSFEIIN
jgi:coatomer protein complex subunit alpha (xenin)